MIDKNFKSLVQKVFKDIFKAIPFRLGYSVKFIGEFIDIRIYASDENRYAVQRMRDIQDMKYTELKEYFIKVIINMVGDKK